jgi:ATP-dependent Clp protease ATP-binding subunit ClpC
VGPFDRFNDRAKRVLALAQDEAIRMHHDHLGVDHLGLALIREGSGVAARALQSLGVDPAKFRMGVERAVPRGDPEKDISEVTLTPRLKRIVEIANEESVQRGDPQTGTEHLLLAIVKEGESVAAAVLGSLGIAEDQVTAEIDRIVRDDRPPPPR